MAFAQISNVRLEYHSRGHGPERIVLLHGFQASARIWEKVQDALPPDRFTSIAINNRGAGQSDAPPEEAAYSVPIFASDAFELATKLGWNSFTLVGHSLGGATAAQFAIDHPQVLKGLVLLDPSSPDGREIEGGATATEAAINGFMAVRRAQQASGGGGDGITASGAADEWLRRLAADMRAAPEQRLRGSMRSMFTIRIGDRLKDLPMPALLLGGDADELIPVSNMLASWAKLPAGSGLHFWHGIGHSPNVDCPQEVARVIERFVEQTIPARTARSTSPR